MNYSSASSIASIIRETVSYAFTILHGINPCIARTSASIYVYPLLSYTLVNCRNFSALPPSLMSLALLIRGWTASLREDFRNSLSIPINDCEAQITRVLESHATNYSTRISSIDGSYRIEASFVPISTTAIRSRIIRSPFNPIQPHLSHRIHRFLDRLDG